jgi:nicotinamide-nucleotide amidase
MRAHVRHAGVMFAPELSDLSRRAGTILRERGETVAVAEGSAGGLISAALLSVPGASAYYLGGTVVYTAAALRAWIAGAVETPSGLRGASEVFADHLARSVRIRLDATWGIGEAGAAGPANPYGDPAGHSWFAVSGRIDATQHVLTGLDDRVVNMGSFAVGALELFVEVLERSPG